MAYGLLWLAIAIMFLISPMVLFQLGVNYEGVGGNPFEKLHPGNMVAMAAFAVSITRGNPFQILYRHLVSYPGIAIYAATVGFLIWFTVFVQKEPFTPLVDTFIPVIGIFFLLKEASRAMLDKYATLLHVIFAANALLALYEYLTGNRLTPYVAGTVQIGDDDWRSTALIGHPLANAMMVGTYIMCLAARGGGGLSTYPRTLMLLLQLASMVAFGARASLIVMSLMLALLAAYNGARIVAGRMTMPIAFVAIAAMTLPLIMLGLLALQEIGFFDRLIERFLEDKGSAGTRIAMFELFKSIPLRDILFGPDQGLISSLKGVEGIESGIESFWVAFVLTYGLLPSSLFFIGLFAFSLNVCLSIRPYAFYVFAFFFMVASTSVSLSAKSPLFGMFVIVVFVMLRRSGTPERTRRRVIAS